MYALAYVRASEELSGPAKTVVGTYTCACDTGFSVHMDSSVAR